MVTRKAELKIKQWISSSKSALIVTGARQVGKTFSIRKCLTELKCNYLEINLVEQRELISVIESSSSVNDLVINLTAATNYSFVKGETILFIDEVQEAKDIVTRIKFWVDEGSFRYILSGSLLGVELNSLRSAPVGYLDEIMMFPLDMEEFLLASSVKPEVIEHLRTCYENKTSVGETVHKTMLKHFKRYLVVGGMPNAVREYVESADIARVTAIQKNIIEMYKLDFTKYEAKDKKLMIISIYDTLSSQLLKQNRRFNYNDIKNGLKFERAESSFLWLASAGVVIPTYNATEVSVPLRANAKKSLLKLYANDVGLLTCMYGNSLRTKILIENGAVNLGGIYENAVAQELNTHGFTTYYYNSHKNGELDFLIEKGLQVLPIDVKSGKDYYVHSAMSKAVSNQDYKISEAYTLTNYDLKIQNGVTYLPVYLCMFIDDESTLSILERIE